ncbi:hypothetical protein QFC24_001653 [Naganishia onofrii]|uniref:Uncharacterized protein n=1 Tax=Naganishia onofrii TaxID=1851511 RepID=A0ACC2XRF4_9TREE|nr:hypothetical protein QFC24_001653 [Naganishia onofrii]
MTERRLDSCSLDSQFQDASTWLTSTPAAANLPTDTKLEIYGLYKVATVGFRPFAKYSAWQSQGEKYLKSAGGSPDAGRFAAKGRYLEIAQQIGWTAADDGDEEGSGERKRSGMGIAVSVMRNDDDDLSPPTERDLPLHDAVADGDLEKVKQELSRSPQSLNKQDELVSGVTWAILQKGAFLTLFPL